MEFAVNPAGSETAYGVYFQLGGENGDTGGLRHFDLNVTNVDSENVGWAVLVANVATLLTSLVAS